MAAWSKSRPSGLSITENRTRSSFSAGMLPLPNCGVENVRACVAFGEIQIDGRCVGFSHGKRNLGRSVTHEVERGHGEQHAGQSEAAIVGMDTELRDVPTLGADARAQHQR